MNEIKCIRTITGEDIVTEIITSNDSFYGIINPATINLTDTNESIRVGLTPFLPFSKGIIILYKHSICAESDLDPNMIEEYKRVYSPIVTPQQSIIMPK
jgi:hypothetical protein